MWHWEKPVSRGQASVDWPSQAYSFRVVPPGLFSQLQV
jgi:hypothetical protein